MNRILLIAHAPLGHALRQCALHVFPEAADSVTALDVLPDITADESFAAARIVLEQVRGHTGARVLILTDVFGATPCNVAQRLVDGDKVRLVAGVNLPMLLRALTYVAEPLETLVQRALTGGAAGVMQVAVSAPQVQARRKHSDQDILDHQQ